MQFLSEVIPSVNRQKAFNVQQFSLGKSPRLIQLMLLTSNRPVNVPISLTGKVRLLRRMMGVI
jgi:hypothetical protein